MSVGIGLHAGEIDRLVSRSVDGVRWLGVFARDELPDVTRELRPWLLILNCDSNNQFGTYWLDLCAPLFGGIKLFDLFDLSSSMN